VKLLPDTFAVKVYGFAALLVNAVVETRVPVTVSGDVAEVLALKVVVPAKAAARECVPVANSNFTEAVPCAFNCAVARTAVSAHRGAAELQNRTSPGVTGPPVHATVAVRVTAVPAGAAPVLSASVVVVAPRLTITASGVLVLAENISVSGA
jgi:hypothetical protein